MAHVVRHALWAAEVARSGHDDKIALERLEVVVHAGHDVWGRPKQQRAHVSVTLTLGSPFTSASSTDSVDASTVHYGTLSKAIQAALQAAIPDGGTAEHLSTAGLCSRILQCVRSVAGPRSLYATEMDVCYLKGSMFGDGAGYTTATLGSNDGQLQSKVLYLRNVRIPCILGVNPNERLQKQPVVLSIWVDGIPDTRVDDYVALETLLFELVSASSFQTIESLLAWLMEELKRGFFTRDEDQDAWVRLRIAKPLAVPFADAAAVEMVRPMRGR